MVYHMNEKQIICDKFKKNFLECGRIIIYGTGKMTGFLIEDFPEHIYAVMDHSKTGDIIHEKKVITFNEAKKSDVRIILIAARYANVKIIYERIKGDCKKHGFKVYDISGILLSKTDLETKSKKHKEELTRLYSCFGMADGSLEEHLRNGAPTVFVAPLIYKYLHWLKKESARYDIVLLSARDGYLLDIVQQAWANYRLNARYFYISRSSALLANMKNENDIIEAMHYPFSGNVRELLANRFLIKQPHDRRGGETDEKYVIGHINEILINSGHQRRNLLKYVESQNCSKNTKVGFVDLVSRGSIQKWLSKITDWNITGLYLAKIKNDENESLPIISMFDVENEYDDAYSFLKNYFLLESVFSSYEPTVKCFDVDGNPQFYKEFRTKQQISSLTKIHNEIVDFGKHMKDVAFDAISPETVDKIFGHSVYFDIDTTFTLAVDEFCGRLS